MPQSKGRKDAEVKKKQTRDSDARAKRSENRQRRAALTGNRAWVAPAFITVGLLGVLWLVVYYIASQYIPFMAQLGPWNLAIGMGLMALSFIIATQWK